MSWTGNEKEKSAVLSAQKPSSRISSAVVPWLTTRSLVASVVLQVLGFFVGSAMASLAGVLFVLGLALGALGLAAFAQVRQRSIAWALFAALPVVGPVIGYAVLRRRMDAPDAANDAPLRALRGAAHVALYIALLGASFAWLAEKEIRDVRGQMPEEFPVLAVVRPEGDAELSAFVLRKRDFARFAREYPEFSYLVPSGTEQTLNKKLRYYDATGEFKLMDIDPPGYFRVEPLGPDRQRFEVRYPIHVEAHVTGWYDATAQAISPARYRVHHEFASGVGKMFAFVFAFGIYLPVVWLLNRYFWSRWRAPEE